MKTSPSRAAAAIRRQFHDLQRRVRQIIYLSGISRVVCLLFGGAILCGLFDWLVQLNDPGLRLLIGLSLAAATGWTAWRWLWTPLKQPQTPASLAALLEHRRPYIGNQLVSAAEFLEQGLHPRLGSPLLQQAVIDRAEQRLASIDLAGVIDRREVRRRALSAAAICGLALFLVALFPTESATAVTRLLFPFGNTPWPRRIQLQLVQHDLAGWGSAARRVAKGDTIELYVRNLKGALPEDVQLEYRIGDDRVIREPMRNTILRDVQGHPVDVAGANLPAARGPIFLRAVGGDDDRMPWFEIAVVSPPEIASLQVRLEPPQYSGRPALTLPAGAGDIQALAGTRAAWTASASQALAEAAIVFPGAAPLPAALDEDGLSLAAEFVLNDPKISGYRFELRNRDGFGSGERGPTYTIRITPDQPPQVTLEDPASDVTATADAVLPLRISLKDDLGLVSARLVFQRESDTEPRDQALTTFADTPVDARLTESWPLEPLELSAGDRLQFRIEAADAYDLGPPHIGRSTARTVTIIGADEKREELTNRLGELLSDLSAGVAIQRRVANQTGELQTQLQTGAPLRPQDADLLRKLDLEQQQAQHRLLEPGDSVRSQADRLLDEFEANHLASNDTAERLESLSNTLTELGREALPELQRRLTQAQKQAADPADRHPERLARELAELGERQAETVRTLEDLEAELSVWQDRRHVSQQLSGLIEAQRGLNRSTRETEEQQLARDADRLSPQDRAQTMKLSQRQRVAAEAVEQFRKHLAEMSESLADKNPELSQRLEELADELETSGVSGDLRDAAGSLAEGQSGQAVHQQDEALRKLESAEDLLENRPPDDQELLVKKMQGVEADLETLHKAESQLAKEWQAAADRPESPERTEELEKLAKRQEELRDKLTDIERQLERLQLKRPQEAVRRAGEQMERLSNDGDKAGERQEAMQETLDDLEQARRDLAQERQRAEEQLAFEQMLRLKDELQGLAQRQAAVKDEAQRLEGQRQERGDLSRGQLRTLLQTAQSERELSQEINGIAKRLSAAEVFALALQKIGNRMGEVAGRLDAKQTDAGVQQSLQGIQAQLERLLTVLSPPEPKAAGEPPGEQQPQPAEAQSAGPPSDVITLIAQLELLKDMQVDCARRTAELQRQRPESGELTPAETAELEAIQQDQTELTDLARNLLSKLLARKPEPPNANPPEGGFLEPNDPAETEPKPAAGAPTGDSEQRKLSDRILKNTKEARDHLAEKATAAPTQELQQTVVDDLEALIELLKKSPPPQQNNSPPSPNSSSPEQNQKQNPNQTPSEEEQSSRNSKSEGDGSGQSRSRPEDSEERHGESAEAKNRAARKRRLESDIWGHLPPALREQLLNTYGERMLPQYEDAVRKFYETLSEPKRSPKR